VACVLIFATSPFVQARPQSANRIALLYALFALCSCTFFLLVQYAVAATVRCVRPLPPSLSSSGPLSAPPSPSNKAPSQKLIAFLNTSAGRQLSSATSHLMSRTAEVAPDAKLVHVINAISRAIHHAAHCDSGDDPLSHMIESLQAEHTRRYLQESTVLMREASLMNLAAYASSHLAEAERCEEGALRPSRSLGRAALRPSCEEQLREPHVWDRASLC